MNNIQKLAEHLKSAVEILDREAIYEKLCGDECVRAEESPEQQYRMLKSDEIIQRGDEVLRDDKWQSSRELGNIVGVKLVGRYRRPIFDDHVTPVKEHIMEERNMALDAAGEVNVMAEELKKAKADLFAYGEFTRNVANALGMGTYEISFSDVLDKIRIGREVHAGHYKDLRNVIDRQEEKLDNAATYIEGLERDLEAQINITSNWESTAAQHLRNEEYYRSLVVQIGEMFGIMSKISDDGSVQDSVLALKVPELVQQHLIKYLLRK